MAFTSYSDLQSEVASWLHRSDLTTEIKSFICLAEADLPVPSTPLADGLREQVVSLLHTE